MKSILLIGGGGYIGTVVIEHFVKLGFKVTIIDNFIYNHYSFLDKFFQNYNDVKVIKEDITKIKNFKNILESNNYVVFLAGLVGDPITKKYPDLATKINRDATKELILEISQSNIENLIYISTCSNYGLIEGNQLANEKHILNPLSLYAKHKVEIENFVMNINNVNFCPTVLRFATAFGFSKRMRLDLTVNEFIYEMCFNKKLLVYDPDTWRPYCHVKDFARLIEKIITTNKDVIKNQIYNAGSDENNYTKRQIVSLISNYITDCEISYQEHGSDPRNYRVSFQKLEKDLNFKTGHNLKENIPTLIQEIKKTKFLEKKNYGNYLINKND
jgi:nucleoside-diphosphate-sugar epimerase